MIRQMRYKLRFDLKNRLGDHLLPQLVPVLLFQIEDAFDGVVMTTLYSTAVESIKREIHFGLGRLT